MESILVSSCLLGEKVRYDGKIISPDPDFIKFINLHFSVVPICPEVVGGLFVPRSPCEIIKGKASNVLDGTAKVLTNDLQDFTQQFVSGAFNSINQFLKIDIELQCQLLSPC
ncbi:MAG: DUF523 domain-containing protein [bacterium]|nr:DUF523 domain-containing protein [bacterium]